MTGDISLMGQCGCGSGPAAPNYDCERCRLVYFVRTVGEMRDAQSKYFSDRNSLNLDRARHLERKIDELVKRFTARPETTELTLFPDEANGGSDYYSNGG